MGFIDDKLMLLIKQIIHQYCDPVITDVILMFLPSLA